MDNSLFRREAIDAANTGMLGTVALYCPPWRWLIISLVIFITLCVAAFFTFGTYTKYETSTGELVPRNGLLVITPPVAGTIVDIPVHEGQWVKEGDVLMVVSSEVSTQLGQTRQMISQQLNDQKVRLRQDLGNLDALSLVETQGLRDDLRSLQLQKQQLLLQQAHRLKQANLAQTQMYKLNAMLKQGYASNRQVEEQESNLLDNQARLQDVQRQILDIEQKTMQTRQQLDEKPLDDRRKRNEIQRQLADNSQSLAENESRRAFELRAPKGGAVGTIMVKTGQMLNAGQSALTILPNNAELQARIMLNTQAIGFIEPGQKVVLRYKAFPYQKFGQQYGRVVEVSRTALTPQEVSNLTGKNNIPEQQYRVMVALDNQTIAAYARKEQLKPGMALDADFIVDRRHIWEWVLEPLFALGHNISI